MPAQAGIQGLLMQIRLKKLDSRFRGNDIIRLLECFDLLPASGTSFHLRVKVFPRAQVLKCGKAAQTLFFLWPNSPARTLRNDSGDY